MIANLSRWSRAVDTDSDDDTGPPQSGALHRVEYSVVSSAPIELCWKIYVDWKNWPLFHSGYGRIAWTKGDPWQRGSHLSIEMIYPIPLNVEHVITAFVPGEYIAWLDHAAFITIEQSVYFKNAPEGGTRIDTWADLVGPKTVKGYLAIPLFKQFTKKWYTEFAEYCTRLSSEKLDG
jgi:hypothetical protein